MFPQVFVCSQEGRVRVHPVMVLPRGGGGYPDQVTHSSSQLGLVQRGEGEGGALTR